MFKKSKKYMTKEEKNKFKLKKFIAASVVIVIAIIIVYQAIVIPWISNDTKERTLASVSKTNTYVYVPKNNIERGKDLQVANFKLVSTNIEAAPTDMVRDINQVNGKVARISLKMNTPLSASMIVDMDDFVTEDLRDVDYSDVVLNKDLLAGQYVDIIYRTKKGDNYTVCSKVKVNKVLAGTLYTSMTATQRQYKDNATVKASLTGGTILTVRYTDPQNQKAAPVTYHLDEKVKALIAANNKIIKKAEKTLQARNKVTNKNKPDFINKK